MNGDTPSERHPTRRSFLAKLLGGTLFAGAATAIAAMLAYLFPSEEVRAGMGPERLRVGKAEDFVAGAGRLTLVDDEPVWVVPVAGGFTALSAICTHKGCIINWDSERRLFACPCHDGLFDERGNVVSGLPRRPLTHFRVGLVNGYVYVSSSGRRQA